MWRILSFGSLRAAFNVCIRIPRFCSKTDKVTGWPISTCMGHDGCGTTDLRHDHIWRQIRVDERTLLLETIFDSLESLYFVFLLGLATPVLCRGNLGHILFHFGQVYRVVLLQ